MSRWSEEFDKHPIHNLLDQADEYLSVEVEETGAALEDERRRLKNVLGNLRAVVTGLDPEFFPKSLLNQVHQQYATDVLNQLKIYSKQKTVLPLSAANDHVTQHANLIFNLAAMSRPQESQEAIENARIAFTSFSSSVEWTANKIDQRFTDYEAELAAVSKKAATLEEKIDDLEMSANDKLTEWQDDFTNKQTTRAEEYSVAQIEREKNFAANLRKLQDEFDREQAEIVARHHSIFEKTFSDFKEAAERSQIAIFEKQEAIRKLHNLVTDETVTGGYHRSAKVEGKAANFWRFASIGCLVITAVWLVIKIKFGFAPLEDGGVNWPEVITASSLTAIFLYAAGYTSRQSKMHRDNEKLLRSYALETQALDPFIASLPSKEQQAIKAELVRRMFGQQNSNGITEPTQLDDGTVKSLVDKVSDSVSDVVGRVVEKR